MKEFLKKSGLRTVILVSIAAIAFLSKDIAQWVVLGAIFVFIMAKGIVYCLEHKDTIYAKKQKAKSGKNECIESESEKALNFTIIQLSHRVTDRLHTLFPECTWTWVDKPTLNFFAKGGRLRIATNKTEEFKEADVILDMFGRIDIKLLNSDSVTELIKTVDKNADTDYSIDVDVWYTQCGHKLLTEIITELNAGGTKVLCINEDGSIVVDDDKQVGTFKSFPSKNLWTKLIGIFEENGLSVVENEHSIQLGW